MSEILTSTCFRSVFDVNKKDGLQRKAEERFVEISQFLKYFKSFTKCRCSHQNVLLKTRF